MYAPRLLATPPCPSASRGPGLRTTHAVVVVHKAAGEATDAASSQLKPGVRKLKPQRPLAASRAACRPRPRGGRNEEIARAYSGRHVQRLGDTSHPWADEPQHARFGHAHGAGRALRQYNASHDSPTPRCGHRQSAAVRAAVTGIGNPPSRIVAIAGRARLLTSIDLCPGTA